MKTKQIAMAGALAVAGAMGGCGQDGPFSLTVNEVNERPPQRNAVIALSDPQIYTRERLLNDRQLEILYLQEQLKQIDRQDFTPRLKRDIDMLIEMAAALSVKFNPIAGAEISQAAELNSLKNDIQIEQMRNLLDQVRKENDRAEESAAGTAGTAATTSTDSLKPDTLEEVVNRANLLLDDLEGQIKARIGEKPTELRKNTVESATPIEVLRDKLAYRNEIQAAIEQAQLDDRHDLNGNALYRLQFKATVFPGQVKDKYGVARLTILPPLFDNNHEVSKLYLDWLAYVAAQLNPSAEQPDSNSYNPDTLVANSYRELGPATGIYRIQAIPYLTTAPALVDPSKQYSTAIADALTELSPQLEAGAVEGSSGQFEVPVPPGVFSAAVLIAVNSGKTEDYLNMFKAANNTLYNYINPKTGFVRWSQDDRGQCRFLTVPNAPFSVQTTPLDLYDGLSASEAQSIEDLNTTLTKAKDVMMAVNGGTWLEPKELNKAVAAARNVHALAPAYTLAIQRTINNFQRRKSPQNDAVKGAIKALETYARNIASLATEANSLLTTLHRTLLAPVRAKLGDRASSQTDSGLYNQILDSGDPDSIQALLDRKAEPESSHDRNGLLSEVQVSVPCLSFADVAGRIYVPAAFYESVTTAPGDHYSTKDRRPYAGPTYAYSTAPAELAQRISTVASATQALDLMMAVSAIIPQAGAGVNAAGKLRQIASGHVDAIESAPLIVGFSNNGAAGVEEELYGAAEAEPNFGWVFGPKVTVDAEKSQLKLSQVLVQQPVTADISVPGWWRSLRLRVETVWAANFEDSLIAGAAFDGQSKSAAQPNERATDYIMDVPLQTNPATYEQLTEYIANTTWGLQYKEPVITTVTPETLPACDKVTLLIAGTDLWRGVQAYIGGIAASEIKIMPDMQGLAATFDLSKADQGAKDLVVWTQLGRVQPDRHVTVVAGDKCAAATNKDIVNATIQGPPTLIPAANETLAFEVKEEFPKSAYRLVLSRPGYNFSINDELVRTGKKTYKVTWPVAGLNTSFGQNKPVNGDVFKVQLFRVNENTTTDLLATLPPVIFFEKPIDQLIADQIPKPAAKPVTADKLTYAASFTLPTGFAAAFGEISAIGVTLKDATSKPVALKPDGKIVIEGNVVTTGFTLEQLPSAGAAYTLTLDVTTATKVITVAFAVKG